MARLTQEEYDGYMQRLSEAANADAEMMDVIGKLKADFNESLSVDVSEVEKAWQEKYDAVASERDRAIGERDESRRAYRERFFSTPADAKAEAKEVTERTRSDSPKTIEQLLGLK